MYMNVTFYPVGNDPAITLQNVLKLGRMTVGPATAPQPKTRYTQDKTLKQTYLNCHKIHVCLY